MASLTVDDGLMVGLSVSTTTVELNIGGSVSLAIDGVASLDQLEDVTITDPTDGQALVYDEDTGEWVNGETVSASSFSYEFEVPENDSFDPVKITKNFPDTGFVAISLYDLGVIGPPDRVWCRVMDRTRTIELTDWVPAGGVSGVFAGSAATGDQLTITVFGPWSED